MITIRETNEEFSKHYCRTVESYIEISNIGGDGASVHYVNL